ncbi:MAG: CHAP domain-containing protein [Curvibacter sp.]|nr:CHAP domain-containing protein [Curvibacter sp.]
MDKFLRQLRTIALPPFGHGKCATHVRRALEAAGASTNGHPTYAKDWGPTLVRIGFRAVSSANYQPAKGDVAVIQGTSSSVPGHIEAYDGRNWISDFVQPVRSGDDPPGGFWPGPSYRNETPDYVIYRY